MNGWAFGPVDIPNFCAEQMILSKPRRKAMSQVTPPGIGGRIKARAAASPAEAARGAVSDSRIANP
jgi:hypothetical protein